MENKERVKKIIKYIYFLCIGIIIGYLLGNISRHDYTRTKEDKVIIYEVDTLPSEPSGWYNGGLLPDSVLNETVRP